MTAMLGYVPVSELELADVVNLEGNPYADPDRAVISFQYEYAEVVGVERETPGCIRVDIEGVDSFGFPPDHEVYRAGSAALDRGEA